MIIEWHVGMELVLNLRWLSTIMNMFIATISVQLTCIGLLYSSIQNREELGEGQTHHPIVEVLH